MDLQIDINSNRTNSDESSAKSPISTVKHFKKSMIVEYEKIEHTDLPAQTTEDSQSSNSSGSSSSTATSKSSTSTASSSSSNKNASSLKSPPPPLPISFTDPGVVKKFKNNYDVTIGSLLSKEKKYSWHPDSHNVPTNIKIEKKLPEQHSKNSSIASSSGTKKPDHRPDGKQSKNVNINSKSDHTEHKHKKKIYCICRKSDTQRFMIGCDSCDEWFHGDCVGVSQSLSNKIKAFYCYICRNKKSSLSIRYKSKFQDILKNRSKHHGLEQGSYILRFLREIKNLDKKEAELLNSSKSSKSPSSSSNSTTHHESKKSTNMPQQSKPASFNFEGEPSKCYGKSNVPGEDILNFVSAISKLGHDANREPSNNLPTTSQAVTTISDYNSNSDRKRKFSGSYEMKSNSETESSSNDFVKLVKKTVMTTKSDDSTVSDSSEEMSSQNDADSENDSNFTDGEEYRIKNKQATSSKSSDSQKLSSSSSNNKKSSNVMKKKQPTSTQNRNKNKTSTVKAASRKRSSSSKSSITDAELSSIKQTKVDVKKVKMEPRQCLGPECINQALDKSKYCSEECGLSLAKNRLVHFLKSRIQQYNESPSFSKFLNESELERINVEVASLRIKLKELEQKHICLDTVIDQARNKTIDLNVEKEREQANGDSNEAEIFCVTCGSLHTEKFALKHMEKCFNKIESQAFFGSYFKTHIDGKSMFCDWYNPATKMYCKRLKAICSEHDKERKVNDDEVCGCPLPKSSYILEDSREICLAAKRTCSIHYKWEKLRRAHIDLERLRIWLKLEELLEQKRINETSLNQRASLLSILLHQTIVNTNQSDTLPLTVSSNENDNNNTATIYTDNSEPTNPIITPKIENRELIS